MTDRIEPDPRDEESRAAMEREHERIRYAFAIPADILLTEPERPIRPGGPHVWAGIAR